MGWNENSGSDKVDFPDKTKTLFCTFKAYKEIIKTSKTYGQ